MILLKTPPFFITMMLSFFHAKTFAATSHEKKGFHPIVQR
ncbi:secreted protein [gut metagenome]|uniref:Secreted protein n=1 Tax=gut metagenome TaxID=749906 RepID=J9GLG9_9ZZZZ